MEIAGDDAVILETARHPISVLLLLRLIGAPLLVAAQAAVVIGLVGRVSPLTAIAALPIGLWEFSLGVWLVAGGFNMAFVS